MMMIDKIHQLFRGHDLILSLSLTPSAQGGFSFPSWELRTSLISLCLLNVQDGAAASCGYVLGDPRQVECAVLAALVQWISYISGRRLVAYSWLGHVLQMWLVEQGLCPSSFMSAPSCRATSCRTRVWCWATAALQLRCWAMSPCMHVSWSAVRAAVISTLPRFHSTPLFLQFSSICYLPVSIAEKPQIRWVIWGWAGLGIHFAEGLEGKANCYMPCWYQHQGHRVSICENSSSATVLHIFQEKKKLKVFFLLF